MKQRPVSCNLATVLPLEHWPVAGEMLVGRSLDRLVIVSDRDGILTDVTLSLYKQAASLWSLLKIDNCMVQSFLPVASDLNGLLRCSPRVSGTVWSRVYRFCFTYFPLTARNLKWVTSVLRTRVDIARWRMGRAATWAFITGIWHLKK